MATEGATDTARRLLESRAAERFGEQSTQVELAIGSGIGAEGFRIDDGPGTARIVGNDERGLIYGVGKFLRNRQWRGISVPKLPVRGIYFATHFHNFYHDAPIDEVRGYLEDLALWGINSLTVWFDMHHFNGIDDPAAQAMLNRLRALLRTAKAVRMDCGLVLIGNEGYKNSPEHMRATGFGRGGFYSREICPNAPGGTEEILREFEGEFAEFESIGIDHVWIWPYDQGSCSCEKCRPWGSNGFLKIAKPVSELARRSFPGCKVHLSMWMTDEQEWEGVADAFATKPDWVDSLISMEDTYAFKNTPPGGLPLMGFPEISMNGMYPWGGFGANPQPKAFQQYWDGFKTRCEGGWPYSEGIFEDINKAIFAQFYWDPDRPAWDIVREYARYEFSPDVAEDVIGLISTLEQNHHFRSVPAMCERDDQFRPEILPHSDAGAEEAFELAKQIDAKLDARARASWRWRVLYIRALLDAELKANDGIPTASCEQAFQELIRIYHAQNAESPVLPPAR